MSTILSRRDFVGAALATSVLPVLTAAAATSPNLKRLVAGTRVLEVNGRPAKIFGLTGPDGRSGLSLAPGERFQVELANEAGTSTIVHWHGQLPPWRQDGFPCPDTIHRERRRASLRLCSHSRHVLDAFAPRNAGTKLDDRTADRPRRRFASRGQAGRRSDAARFHLSDTGRGARRTYRRAK